MDVSDLWKVFFLFIIWDLWVFIHVNRMDGPCVGSYSFLVLRISFRGGGGQ